MKTNVIFIILTLLLFQFQSNAQGEIQKPELKIYYNYSLLKYQKTYGISNDSYVSISPDIKQQAWGEISFALIMKPKKSFYHEIELMPLYLNKSKYINTGKSVNNKVVLSGSEATSWNSRFRYQVGYTVITNEKFKTYLGFLSMLNYFNYKIDPYTSIDFSVKYEKGGVIFGLTPEMDFKLSDALNLTFDVPVGIYGLNMNFMRYDSSNILDSVRKQNKFSSELWDQGFQVRIGFGVNL